MDVEFVFSRMRVTKNTGENIQKENSDREEENAFIPTVIDSFNHLLIQQVAATFLPQGRHCVQLKRGHSFTLPSNTRILLHPFFHLPLPHLARKAETRSTPLFHKWGNGCLDGALDWQNFSLKPYHRSERAPSGLLKMIKRMNEWMKAKNNIKSWGGPRIHRELTPQSHTVEISFI